MVHGKINLVKAGFHTLQIYGLLYLQLNTSFILVISCQLIFQVVDTSQKKETMEEFGQQFFGLIVAYDEVRNIS